MNGKNRARVVKIAAATPKSTERMTARFISGDVVFGRKTRHSCIPIMIATGTIVATPRSLQAMLRISEIPQRAARSIPERPVGVSHQA
jgi:hypothetical protein